MGAPKNAGYKRSWKNYLINARYQLRFTLTMVGLCAVLMAGLGWFVLGHVRESNEISKDNIRGAECQQPVAVAPPAALTPERPVRAKPTVVIEDEPTLPADAADKRVEPQRVEPQRVEPQEAEPPVADPPVEPGDMGEPVEAERPERRPVVTITEPEVDHFIPVAATVRYHLCRRLQASAIDRINNGREQMLLVIVVASVLISLGLGLWGIKMTHKVAGPLYKAGLYFDKMGAGRFDTVYNLRKGDQLVSFYDHFKEAHAGMKAVDTADLELMRELIAAADAAGIAGKSPEVEAALADMRAIVARKEAANRPRPAGADKGDA